MVDGSAPPVVEEAKPLPAPPDEDTESPWAVAIESAFLSKYVWRGSVWTDGAVWQPSCTVQWKKLSCTVFLNMDLSDANGESGEFNEIDLTIDYSSQWKRVIWSAGLSFYHYPNAPSESTLEGYLGLGLDVPLEPTLTFAQDVDEAGGLYVSLAASHSFESVLSFSDSASLSVDLSASLGYGSHSHNAYYYGIDDAGLADFTVGLAIPIRIGEHTAVTPSLHASWLLDGEIRAASADPDLLWAGLALSWDF